MRKQELSYFDQGMQYGKKHLPFDFLAAIITFLVSIPFCLGIAVASGAPLFSGIFSGIIGGILVGAFSGSQVSVSGPSAGGLAIVLMAVSQLGDFHSFLLALFLAGLIQIALGYFKAGVLADFVPSPVIQGLLCAIGILLIIKQLPLAFTLSNNLHELKSLLLESTESFSFPELYQLSFHINTGATVLSLLSLAVLFYLDTSKRSWLKYIPGPIAVVLLGLGLNEFFAYTNSYLEQHSLQLVNLPKHEGLQDFLGHIKTPNWSALSNPHLYYFAFGIAIISSVESLLNLRAGEKIDKKHRYCSKDRELIAQGLGNSLAGLLGGLPITSAIARTSVNIQSGAKTKGATILNGIFILLTVVFIPEILSKIPLSSLAAILMYTGYTLNKPSIYLKIYRQGLDRFTPFLITLTAVVTFNILYGILLGLLASFLQLLYSNSRARLDIVQEHYPNGITYRLILPQQTSFLNKAGLVTELNSIPKGAQLIIDARYADYIDKDTIEFLKEFQNEQAPLKKISLNLMGFKEEYNIHNFVDFINVTTYDLQSTINPKEVLNILKEGNQRFLSATPLHRSLLTDLKQTAKTQHPLGVVLGCIDSRVPVETVFDMSFGDLFCARVAGQVVNQDMLASIEYACGVVGAKLIVVLGHTRCGAILSACDDVKKGHITELLAKIKPAIAAEDQITEQRNSSNADFVSRVTELNIANSLLHLYQESPILRELVDKAEIGMVGALYDVSSGSVYFRDYSAMVQSLDPIDGSQLAEALKTLL